MYPRLKYTIQPAVQPVVQPAVSCKHSLRLLSLLHSFLNRQASPHSLEEVHE